MEDRDGQDCGLTLDLIEAARKAAEYRARAKRFPRRSAPLLAMAGSYSRRVEALAGEILREGAELASKAPSPHRAGTRAWRG